MSGDDISGSLCNAMYLYNAFELSKSVHTVYTLLFKPMSCVYLGVCFKLTHSLCMSFNDECVCINDLMSSKPYTQLRIE